MIGPSAFFRSGLDIITQEVTVAPLLHSCLQPTLDSNARQASFTLDSGPYALVDKLTAR